MRLKNRLTGIIVFFICVLPVCLFAQADKNVTIEGHLKNFNNQVLVEDLSEMQYLLLPDDERIIVPDAEGYFKIRFSIESPDYFRLGRNILYLTPGDSMVVLIDKSNPRKAVFQGKGSSANRYLKYTPFPKGGSYLDAGSNLQKTVEATIDTILRLAALRKAELNDLKGVTRVFRSLETARIKADIINSLEDISVYGPYVLKLKDDSAKAYIKEVKVLTDPLIKQYSKDFVSPSLLKLVVYRDIASGLLKQTASAPEEDTKQIKDWLTADALVQKMNAANGKQALSVFAGKIDAVGTPKYKNALKKYLDNRLAFGNGDTAVDFVAEAPDGNKVSLSSLKGKVIYIDIWATWCGPCMEEMPFFEQLKEKYKDNPAIAFVSMSIDDGQKEWKQSLRSRNAQGIQWLINRNKLNAYHVVGIPRTIIVDQDFTIADINAPVPSSKESEKIINNLLKKGTFPAGGN